EPAKHGKNLLATADGKLTQAPIAEAGVDAFAGCASFVDALAVRALHPFAPSYHSGPIVPAQGIGVGLVLAVGRRAVDLDALGCGPFDIVVLVEPTIDEVPLRPAAIALLDSLEHGPHQTAVRTDRLHAQRDCDLALGHACNLTIIRRPEA